MLDLNVGVAKKIVSMTWSSQTTLLCTLVGFFSLVLYVVRNKRKPKYVENENLNHDTDNQVHFTDLPSPRKLPIVGHMLHLGSQPHVVLTEWGKQYQGKLFRIKMGFQEVLVVTGYDKIKNAMLKQSATFAGRPKFETSKLVCEGLSLTFSDYTRAWEHQKISAKAAVSFYTTGKDPTKRTIMETSAVKHANSLAQQLIEAARIQKGIVDPRDYVLANVSNSVCSICFGQDFDINDQKLKELLDINRNFDEAMGASQPVNFWPILKNCPMIARSFRKLEVYMNKFWNFVSSLLDTHWETYDENNARDLTDCLYQECEKERRNNNEKMAGANHPNGCAKNGVIGNGEQTPCGEHAKNGINGKIEAGKYTLNERTESLLKQHSIEDDVSESEIRHRIINSTGDIFGAGYDTLFTTMHWVLFYMAVYPNTQKKMWEEINRVMSPEEDPSFRLHGSKCPYTVAWIYEMLRFGSHSPLLLPHSTTKDTVFENCYIPAGTMVYFNAWQANKDPQIWGDPEVFRPERFLEEVDGMLTMKPNAASKLLVWGLGMRKCLGHQLSKHLIFIFTTTLVRQINVQQAKAGVEPALPWPTTFGLTLKPKNFKINISER